MDFPPSAGPVDQLFNDYHSLSNSLGADAVSDHVALDTHFRKLFVLAAASHLESLMSFHMHEYFAGLGSTPYEFIRRESLERKFFRWFNFDSPKPTSFFKSFGTACHELYAAQAADNEPFDKAGQSFMFLCTARNTIVHENLATATLEATASEIEKHFRSAVEFPDMAMRIVRQAAG
ncbi:hypothetical protein [Nocardioides iriomotensis]|uniref:RiboL-PSP-HEPN domain-containing protein n=1 Tax=Nocardioides iriomotensis TaxID=715784 RepID=A0A4V1Z150_9ACTN|nr:hypothetical protein [Nocardioides iriomotensis]RYU09676.1 hypothetical protein ETU37_21865 [Nocardioides iriomotensis]